MSLADKLKKKNEEREVAGKHPLIAMGLSREVRDAYFRGVALAAFIDDGNVDDPERAYLRRVGLALNLPEAEVTEMLDALSSDCKSEDEQLSLLEEISCVIKQPQVVKLFLAEFSLIWKSYASKLEDLSVYRVEIAKMLGVQIPDAFWRDFDSIASEQEPSANENKMLDGFDQAVMAYLFSRYACPAGVGGGAFRECISAMTEAFSACVGSSLVAKPQPASISDPIHINASRCTGCGACVNNCAQSAIDVVGDLFSINTSRCNKCGTCIPKCPCDAIVRGEPIDGDFLIILRNCGGKTCSVANVIMEITGMKPSEARSIALSGGRCLMKKLSYEKAIYYQERFLSIGATADVVKA